MTKDTKLSKLVINKLTTEQYNSITTKDPNQLYVVTDAPGFDESRTNCITGISQDIKLELNNGTLTLKAGSKVYVPNGFESDGVTPKFTEVAIQSDISMSGRAMSDFAYYNFSNGSLTIANSNESGSTQPSSTVMWYDTVNNIIRKVNNGTLDTSYNVSFPICKVGTDGTTYFSIDQVFNGFGYIGSTIFALPGVKGLIPNGRNTDGSLKNIEIALDNVTIVNNPDTDNKLQYLMLESNGAFTRGNWYHEQTQAPSWVSNNNNIWYNPETNKMYYYRSSTNQLYRNFIFTGLTFRGSDGSTRISEFNQAKLPFCAVDRSDSSWVSAQAMPSGKYIDLTLGASGSTYTAPANGWFTISKTAGTAGAQINFSASGNSLGVLFYSGASITSYCKGFIPAKKGQTITIQYSATGETNIFRFIYAEGEN